MNKDLAGVVVLVTRPRHQADELSALIEDAGGEALRFPTLEIDTDVDVQGVANTIGDIAAFDIAIFISTNAVQHGVRFLEGHTDSKPLLAAIGPSTARALADAGFQTDVRATRGFTSEALLLEPAFRNIDGKRIVIFRGVGGRATLGRELERRGAEVVYAEVYRRDRPERLDPAIEAALAAKQVDAVTATSAETLVNLYELAQPHALEGLLATQLVTASDRVVKKAAALGFERPALLAGAPDNDALVRALSEWRRAATAPEASTEQMMTEPTTPLPRERDDEREPAENAEQPAAHTADETVDTSVTAAGAGAAKARARSGGGVLGLLAMLVALAALALSGWLWWERRGDEALAQQQLAAAGDEVAALGDEIAALDGKLQATTNRLSEMTASRGRTDSRLDDLGDSLEAIGARIQGVEKSIDDVRGVSATARDNWIRAEAEYFLQTANSRLQLARDPDAALAALLAADDRIETLGDPALFRVRQTLAAEIEALRSVPRPDIEGIAHTLNGLATRVDTLPLKNSVPEPYGAGDATPEIEGESAMQRFKATLGGVLGDMVSVKRTDEAATPLLSRDEEFFLKRNLELQLQTARLALLRGDAANFRESLRTARNWIQQHFLTGDSAVLSAIETLSQLETENIAPALPDVSESLRQLRRAAATTEDAA